jgi:hypothetical protein
MPPATDGRHDDLAHAAALGKGTRQPAPVYGLTTRKANGLLARPIAPNVAPS